MAELRRYSFEMLLGARTDHLSIKELEDGGLQVGQDDGDRECVHALTTEQTRNLVEELGLDSEGDWFFQTSRFVEDGGARELVSVLHSGDYRATFVWP
jgi:hypothetical protein